MKRIAIILVTILASCATFKPFSPGGSTPTPTGTPERSIFAASGLGESGSDRSDLIRILKQQLSDAGANSTLLMLGNFGLKTGFPDSSHLQNQLKYDVALNASIDLASGNAGTTYFIPGLYEWSNGRLRGHSRLNGLQSHLAEIFDNEEILLPGDGCPGPVEVALDDNTVLMVIDTQWWFQAETGSEESGCEVQGKGDFIVALSDAVKRNYDKQLIVTGFHPLYSNGPSSGYYPASKHFLPPVIGTLHSFYKRRIGDAQDISNFGYKIFRTIIRRSLANHPNVVYLSAKEKSLQHFKRDQVHMIVSGSFADPTAVSHKDGPEFAYGRSGFTRIDIYANGDTWLSFWGANDQGGEELIYQSKLYQWTQPDLQEVAGGDLDFTGQSRTGFGTKKHEKKEKQEGFDRH